VILHVNCNRQIYLAGSMFTENQPNKFGDYIFTILASSNYNVGDTLKASPTISLISV